jgi:uncharacterized protein (DUF697 family)
VKKLPKAITRTADDMREAAFASAAQEQPESPARSLDLNKSTGASSRIGRGGDVIEMAPQASSAPAAGTLVRAAPTPADPDAGRRRSRARAIVERHTTYSAIGGIVPVPIVNVASVTAIIVRMVKALSTLYGVPFERDRARATVVALMGGAMPTGLASVTASTLVYVIPGSNLIGLAVSSLAAAACTRGIGRIFVEHFESGTTPIDFPVIDKR